jgi:competence protein ComEC
MRRNVAAYLLLSLILANIGVWREIRSVARFAARTTTISMLDVGQGDAVLIRNAAGNLLIDGGRSGTALLAALGQVLEPSERTIDVVVVSHPQLDHIGGLPALLDRYHVRLVVMTGVSYPLSHYRVLLDRVAAERIPVLLALRGETIVMADDVFRVIAPETPLEGVSSDAESINDTSIVMRLDAGGVAAVFTGDITARRERMLQDAIGDIDILKVSHHGSKYSSDASFLARLTPAFALIGVGKNSYGHPAAETLARLAAVGARVLRTDTMGTVTLTIRDGTISVQGVEYRR